MEKNLEAKPTRSFLVSIPTALGDLQASLLIKELGPLAKKISRSGKGAPNSAGANLSSRTTKRCHPRSSAGLSAWRREQGEELQPLSEGTSEVLLRFDPACLSIGRKRPQYAREIFRPLYKPTYLFVVAQDTLLNCPAKKDVVRDSESPGSASTEECAS